MAADDVLQQQAAVALAHQILVVEDDVESAAFLKELLEGQGYAVAIAKDGGQTHAAFSMRRPDFVILDLILPGESGFEICERLKQTEESVPVLILTAIDLRDARDLAVRVGADGYMTKPFDPDELLERVREIAEDVWQRTHTTQIKETSRIRFSCRCGKKFKVSPTHRGKAMTCPRCGEPVTVPRRGGGLETRSGGEATK